MKSSPVAIDDALPDGERMHALARRLFPIARSLTGDGVRETLNILCELIPLLTIHEVPSGTRCFDWTVPPEWNVRSARLLDPDGQKLVDFADNNLHLLGYSVPVDRTLDLDELQDHLYSLPEMPDAIPYVTSYYKERWGFCLPHRLRSNLKPGRYRAIVDSTLVDGFMTYGELLLPGKSQKEVFLSTYICHPSMANNELSGPCVTTFLATWLQSLDRNFSYRIVFIPETIGSILYLSQHLDELRRNVFAGFNISCVGDERAFSYLPSRAMSFITLLQTISNTHFSIAAATSVNTVRQASTCRLHR
jgi:aminopeptidase-like protein